MLKMIIFDVLTEEKKNQTKSILAGCPRPSMQNNNWRLWMKKNLI